MASINFITTEPPGVTSGGWSGISRRMYEQLCREHNVHYIGPVRPPSNTLEKSISKLNRVLGLKGAFHFFSEKRLQHIQQLVKPQRKEAALDFFFGQTPWIKCQFNTPYAVYIDAAFPTYVKVFSQPGHFSKKDLGRIEQQEKEWLSKASTIFWGSDWALQEAQKEYGITYNNSVIVHTGGNIEVPAGDVYNAGAPLQFTFISLDFINKGGWVCVKAFLDIQKQYPDARLFIIGQQPPPEVLNYPGVEYAGFLRKTEPAEYAKFKSLVQQSTFLIHPTVKDTMGAVIIESGYFGCPSIAPRSFGVPELIRHNETGILVNTPFTEHDFATPLLALLADKQRYMEMRRQVREFTTTTLTWNAVGDNLLSAIKELV